MAFSRIHVVAGVLEDGTGRMLIARRPPGKTMAGAWEFPGGKIKAGESRFAGLVRELQEELGIHVESARPLIRYRHVNSEHEVDLDAWRVTHWRGEPDGRDGQELAWRRPDGLLEGGLLTADAPIVNALRLPPLMLITPAAAPDGEAAFVDRLGAYAESQGRSQAQARSHSAALICLRRPDLDAGALLKLAADAGNRVKGTGTKLLLHGDPAAIAPLLLDSPSAWRVRIGDAVAGLHVPARFLPELSGRPVPASMWFGASCHSAAELHAAVAAGIDYALLGNVLPTASHPGRPGLGWETFAALVAGLPLPVYAIGGLGPEDLETAWAAGAQGIAAIRGLWPR